jgi:hypothetical protein
MYGYIVVHGIRIAKSFESETFGRLTTIGPKFMLPVGNKGEHKAKQVCRCECGNLLVVTTGNLHSSTATSCGCIRHEKLVQRNTTHRKSKSAEYRVWSSIQQRCYNPKMTQYCDWGGRGIRVCDRWLEPNGRGFLNFLEDMGPKPRGRRYSIERRRGDENYCPENCHWATSTEQNRNRRNNRLLIFNGKTQCLAAWAEELGMSQSTLGRRIRQGWTIEQVLAKHPVTPSPDCANTL